MFSFQVLPVNIEGDNLIITFDPDIAQGSSKLHSIEEAKLNEQDGGQISLLGTVKG
jgi:hypothetical protein